MDISDLSFSRQQLAADPNLIERQIAACDGNDSRIQAVRRLIMVGDNRNTDIAGAQAAGMASLLLADGIHHEQLLRDGELDRAGLEAFLAEPGATPTHVAARLTW